LILFICLTSLSSSNVVCHFSFRNHLMNDVKTITSKNVIMIYIAHYIWSTLFLFLFDRQGWMIGECKFMWDGLLYYPVHVNCSAIWHNLIGLGKDWISDFTHIILSSWSKCSTFWTFILHCVERTFRCKVESQCNMKVQNQFQNDPISRLKFNSKWKI
jgi:hypothetical protein